MAVAGRSGESALAHPDRPHVGLQQREIRSLWTSLVWAVAHTATILRVRTTQRKGDVATARAIATFTAMGFDVSIPLTESAAYDLVVDDGERLARVQCKFA